jgi:hypothetical protein
VREHVTQLTRAWREYCRLYPEDLRRDIVAPMARLIATGTGSQTEREELACWTMRAKDCSHHEAALAGFERCVLSLWQLRAGGSGGPPISTELSELEQSLAILGVEVYEETPFDDPPPKGPQP